MTIASQGCADRRIGSKLLGFAFAVTASFVVTAVHAERFQALDVAGTNTLALSADPRFDAADQGTVELSLAVAPLQPAGGQDAGGTRTLCIAEHGAGSALNWRLSLLTSGDSDTLRFGRDADGQHVDVLMKLRGTGYHHFAFVTAGGRTQLIVDGTRLNGFDANGAPQPGVEFGYRPATPEGLPLTFGCAQGPTAKVWISSFRLWGAALVEEDLRETARLAGPMTRLPRLEGKLLAYSLFTDRTREVRLTDPRIRFTDFKGAEGGTPFFFRRPRGQEWRTVSLSGSSDFRLGRLAVEYHGPQRVQEMTDGDSPERIVLPTVLPRRTTVPAAERAAFLAAKIGNLVRPGGLPAGSPEAEAFKFYRAQLIEAEAAVRASVPGGSGGPGQSRFSGLGSRIFSVSLLNPSRFRSVVASYGPAGIKAVSFDTDTFAPSALLGFSEGRQDVFGLELPPQTRLEGVAGRVGQDGELRALALAYSPAATPANPDLADSAVNGIWVEAAAVAPVRDPGTDAEMEASAFNGTYGDQTVYRFLRLLDARRGPMLRMIVDASGTARTPFRSHDFVRRQGNEWAGVPARAGEFDKDGDTLWLDGDRIRWGRAGDTDAKGIFLVRPAPEPEAADENKLPWGATFSLEHRPNGVVANFKGYNPARMRARDYQATTGADKFLFKMPDDAGTDYTATDSRLIVPHGLIFSLDSNGSENADSSKLDSDVERQKAWMIGLGGKLEIPMVLSFSADGSHQQSQETVDKAELSIILNRAIVSHYALVLDKSRMQLSDEFRAKVVELRNRQVAAFPIDWGAFFDSFGTYYPYAVTYGGMAWSETTVNASQSSTSNSTDDKASASASFPLDFGADVGISVNSEYSQGSKTGSGSTQERTNYGTYGGSFSKGGGWSVGRGEELPVLLDLRPIPDLLSPAFFDDPAIFRDLRAEMQVQHKKHDDDAAIAAAARHPWGKQLAPPPDADADPGCTGEGEICYFQGSNFP